MKYKIKTHKGIAKRFLTTCKHKVKYFSSGLRHGLRKKTRQKKRFLKKTKYLKTSSIKNIKRFIYRLQ